MTRTTRIQKVMLSVLISIAAVVGVLIAVAWVTRTPLSLLQAVDRLECMTLATAMC